ncbi:Aspartate/methionine/tyrosine aminotransferase [Malonomonas rubra DSM 5091]|uniref:alanine transaminase n=1 Tax=Malonomonas rubra DSM 5091 TaxID=1122189 RepID=A0A1M6L9T9_MALRU|nr:pyridoxal phosphate-dependent aminotransferase [Malonomonas rubra]SHJ67970.1 Aspartate/methionine/tyrosine aminotransferase [Malonomonas rubra DSM 5091]
MRNNIVHIGAGELTYEIRAIVDIAEKLKKLGIKTNMENIGDPVAKGEKIPDWIKGIVADLAMKDCSYGYCATKGVLETREFLAELTNKRGKTQITAEDIIFFNGLGDAIQKVYGLLKREARVLGPSPTYSTHSSAEGAHAGQKPVTYRLDPENNWYPDIDDMRLSIKYNPAISAILVINPDNPTGAVYPERILKEIIALCKEYDLFLICDEIYHNLCYNGTATRPISDLIGDLPAIAMKGISKEVPWPGARCGWIEVYNADKDPMFAKYVESILNSKMVEVCSTTLPQKAIPAILSHEEYPKYLEQRKSRYENYSNIAYNLLKEVPGLKVNRTNGAFYMSVVFEKGLLNSQQTLDIENAEVKQLVEELVNKEGCEADKRFVYYLLASTGICVVPISSFCTDERGFRITLLELDEKEFTQIFITIANAVTSYLRS